MKTKYTNFKHWASSAPEPTFVPEHLIRKHWSLQLIEVYHITICVIIAISSYLTFTKSLFIYTVAFTILFVAFCSTVFLSINDNYQYRTATFISHALACFFSCIAFIFTNMNLALFATLTTQSLLVLIVLFSLKKNREYYKWCKSIANRL